MSEYDFELKHQPGTKMVLADALSRRPDLGADDSRPTETVMLPETLFVNLIDTAIRDNILESKKLDQEANNALSLLLEEGPSDLRNDLEKWT